MKDDEARKAVRNAYARIAKMISPVVFMTLVRR